MRFDKFTIKSQEVIQNSQALVAQYNNQQIEPKYLQPAMLAEKEGIAGSMLRNLGVSPDGIAQEGASAIEKLPKFGGGRVGEIYILPRSKTVIEAAFAEASKMKVDRLFNNTNRQ